MQNLLYSRAFGLFLGASLFLLPVQSRAASDPWRGLWVGEVTAKKVNEVGADAYLIAGVTPPNPAQPTPTASEAHFRLLVHVDANGKARLLKSVAVFVQTNSSGNPFTLVTDRSLYPNFSEPGKRISAVAFDFGDLTQYRAITNVAGKVAAAAATAAGAAQATAATVSTAALAAANAAIAGARTNAPGPTSSNYITFVNSAQFTGPVASAATAAAAAAYQAATNGGALPETIRNRASSAALEALTGAFTAGDALVLNEVDMTGNLAPGSTSSAAFFLGAFHPTNPFRHFRHPDHSQGYDIIRTVQLVTDSVPAATPSLSGGYGVDRLTGVYREEIHGLHKPLGPDRNIGLKTEGVFTLNRATLADILNH
ncbi:MAG: hypothetical protein JWM16_4799 [Verrucomicrobiales bacterium]|nr:hypothetical protein [Verrucomicrobiales bacterium]